MRMISDPSYVMYIVGALVVLMVVILIGFMVVYGIRARKKYFFPILTSNNIYILFVLV